MQNRGRVVVSGFLCAVSAIAPTAPAAAQDAPAAADAAEDTAIIVTARRTEERLSDVPISISVLSQQALTDRNVVQLADLATYTPGLSVNQRFGPERATFAIRGFTQDPGTSPSVGVYFAEVPGIRVQGGSLSGNTQGPGVFMDLQNVQVLKGPQGTLFGRNTTGGAILLVPARPTDRFEGWAEGQVGNYDLRRGQAVLNIPLADTFKVRFAVDRNKREGYLRNGSGIGPDDYNDVDYLAVRGTVLAELTPTLENSTIVQYSRSNTNGYAARLVSCNRATPANPANFAAVTAAAACDQIDRQAARGDGLLDVDVATPGAFLKIEQYQIINTTIWEPSTAITIKNIASYGEYTENSRISSFSDNLRISARTPRFQSAPGAAILPLVAGTPFNLSISSFIPGNDAIFKTAFTEELQIQGRTDAFTWVVGGYYERNRQPNPDPRRNIVSLSCLDLDTPQCTDPFGIGSISEARNKYDYDSKGVFAEGTYDFTDRFALTLGARYTYDRTHAEAENSRIVRIGTPTQARVCTDTFHFNSGFNAAGRPNALTVTNPSQCHFEYTEKSNDPTWNAVLTFKPNEDMLLYGRYARGYRQGGINTTAVGVETWKPETVDAFEIGAKTTFAGAVRGYFNAALFYNRLHDTQVSGTTVPLATSGLTPGTAVLNVGTGTIKGGEIDASALFFDSLRIDVGYTHLDTRISGVPASVPVAGGAITEIRPLVVNGSGLTFAPKNRVTATATYTLPLPPSAGELSVGATFTHTDRQVANAQAPFGILPSTDLLNLNLTWNGVLGGPFDLGLFATNVTDRHYAVATTTSANAYDNILLGLPRLYGVRLRFNFGG